MRAQEFIKEHESQQIDEIAPFVAALGGALARGAAAAGTALARGAVSLGGTALRAGSSALKTAGQTALSTAARTAGTQIGTNIANKLTGQGSSTSNKPPPVTLPSGTKIEPMPPNPSKPNELQFKVGDGVFTLDTKKPENANLLRQLGQLTPSQ